MIHTTCYHASITHMPTITKREAHLRTHTHLHLHFSSTECSTGHYEREATSTAACNPQTNTHTHADLHGEAHELRACCVWVFLRGWTRSYHVQQVKDRTVVAGPEVGHRFPCASRVSMEGRGVGCWKSEITQSLSHTRLNQIQPNSLL